MKSIPLKYFLKNQLASPCPKFNEDVYENEMKPLMKYYRKYLISKTEDENRYIDCWCKKQAKNGERI